ncbi:winged helix-turn-helix transcriptional regulator [Deinococcus sp. Arct2-2]|nr:winged helix-turn-helix transcriptional regulator [Deinococcus sp. Arct2-2]
MNADTEAAFVGCACINTRMAARALTRLYDEALAPSGVRITQFAVLAAVAFHGPFTMKALAKVLVMDRTTLTADLRPLEAQGFVTVVPGEDRRTRVVTITPRGREAVRAAAPLWQGVQARIEAGIGAPRLQALLSDLREVTALTQDA